MVAHEAARQEKSHLCYSFPFARRVCNGIAHLSAKEFPQISRFLLHVSLDLSRWLSRILRAFLNSIKFSC